MFARAVGIARHFTRPVVISFRNVKGDCDSAIGAFVVINREGWIVTTWHTVDLFLKMSETATNVQKYLAAKARIESNGSLPTKQRKQQLAQLGKAPPSNAVTHVSAWWGWDGVKLDTFEGIPAIDVVFGKLQNFNAGWVAEYPVFKDPSRAFDPGTSLCKLGFPFHSIKPTYDPATNNFGIPSGSVPFFPIEGIFTRIANVVVPDVPTPPPFPLRMIETSSPGLRGQSGGPIFDQRASVWGIQSRTMHYSLGFDPEAPGSKKGQKEHQFLNAGLGIHAGTLADAMRDLGIAFAVSDY